MPSVCYVHCCSHVNMQYLVATVDCTQSHHTVYHTNHHISYLVSIVDCSHRHYKTNQNSEGNFAKLCYFIDYLFLRTRVLLQSLDSAAIFYQDSLVNDLFQDIENLLNQLSSMVNMHTHMCVYLFEDILPNFECFTESRNRLASAMHWSIWSLLIVKL